VSYFIACAAVSVNLYDSWNDNGFFMSNLFV